MKYYPFIYQSMDDMAAAQRGEPMVMNSDGYFVRVKKDEPEPAPAPANQ